LGDAEHATSTAKTFISGLRKQLQHPESGVVDSKPLTINLGASLLHEHPNTIWLQRHNDFLSTVEHIGHRA
jgi:hypothetical protein